MYSPYLTKRMPAWVVSLDTAHFLPPFLFLCKTGLEKSNDSGYSTTSQRACVRTVHEKEKKGGKGAYHS